MIPKNLTITERQILANQFKILANFGVDSKTYETNVEILESGFTGEYHEVFNLIFDEIDYETCKETNDILNMYRRINNAIALLSEEEKVEMNLERIEFEGFDGNHNPHYNYMSFMVEKLNIWQEYKDQYLNSHSEIPLVKYKRMLEYQSKVLTESIYDFDKNDLNNLIEVAN